MSEVYSLRIAKPVVKSLKSLDLKVSKQIMTKILSLQSNSQLQDRNLLKGHPNSYRVDQGEYRILYTFEKNTITIFTICKYNDGKL